MEAAPLPLGGPPPSLPHHLSAGTATNTAEHAPTVPMEAADRKRVWRSHPIQADLLLSLGPPDKFAAMEGQQVACLPIWLVGCCMLLGSPKVFWKRGGAHVSNVKSYG